MNRLLTTVAILIVAGNPPAPAPARFLPLLGEYGEGPKRVIVRESGGRLEAITGKASPVALSPSGPDRFLANGVPWLFRHDASGRVTSLVAGGTSRNRISFPEDGAVFRIHPLRPVEELRRDSVHAKPPAEPPSARKPDLEDLTSLKAPIHLDIRYATANNFMGAPMYSEARAFLQRPAAEALARAALSLQEKGYGLLIHDAYRPWYVTWMFWEATPPPERIFVANPAEGSRHNRGCAVDLSLYEIQTGKPVAMPSVYDEMTDRAFPDYPGGTTRQRWTRALLREAMEKQGFEVFHTEWWHFDYRDWKAYPIGTVPFEKLDRQQN